MLILFSMLKVMHFINLERHFSQIYVLNLYLFFIYKPFFNPARPEEQDDSENSTIYITGLTETVTMDEMAEFFKHVGPIRVRRNDPSCLKDATHSQQWLHPYYNCALVSQAQSIFAGACMTKLCRPGNYWALMIAAHSVSLKMMQPHHWIFDLGSFPTRLATSNKVVYTRISDQTLCICLYFCQLVHIGR